MPCFHKLPSAIKVHDNLQEMYSHIEKKLECVETALTKAIESQLHSHIEKKLESVETTLTKAIESQLHPHIEKS